MQMSQIAARMAPYFASYGGDRGKQVAMVLADQTKYKVGGGGMSRMGLIAELAKAGAAMGKMEAA